MVVDGILVTEAVEEPAAAQLETAGDVLELDEGFLPLTVENARGVGEGGVGREAFEVVAGAQGGAGFERLEGDIVLGVVVATGELGRMVSGGATADANDVEVRENDAAERYAFAREQIDFGFFRRGVEAKECGGDE